MTPLEVAQAEHAAAQLLLNEIAAATPEAWIKDAENAAAIALARVEALQGDQG